MHAQVRLLIADVAQRKVFTTPDHNEADDASVTNILPKVRGLNKVEGVPLSPSEKNVTEANDVHGQTILQVRAALASNHVVRPVNLCRRPH